MEQKSDYPRLMLLCDADRAACEAASIQDALQIVQQNLFNVSGFECEGGKAHGFHAINVDSEYVKFVEPVNLDGSIHQVLEQLQHAQHKAVKRDINACCENKWSAPAAEYSGAAEAVLVADQVHFTKLIGDSLSSATDKMKEIVGKFIDHAKTDMSKAQRQILNSRITSAVYWHTLAARLESAGCKDPNDAMWKDVLKFYRKDDHVFAEIDGNKLNHDYQYYGDVSALAVTELTEYCYKNTVFAVLNKKPFASFGPAGTGKTETLKDLAKKIGKFAYVNSCSDQFDDKKIALMLQTASACNFWIIFDEFNRIHTEFIEKFSDYVTVMFAAKANKMGEAKHDGDNVVFKLDQNHDLGIFITMNPGYAGRTKLPDSLTSLLQQIDMKVPEYSIIAANILACGGFRSYVTLGHKLDATLKASRFLPPTDWYDFMMRKYHIISKTAGSILKESGTAMSEDEAVLAAMKICMGSMIKAAHQAQWDSILNIGWPLKDFVGKRNTTAKIPTGYTADQFQHLAYCFEQMMKHHHSHVVFGHGTGFIESVAEDNKWHVEKLEKFDQNTVEMMYGTDTNRFGILTNMVRRCCTGDLSKKEGIKLIVLQCYNIDAIFVENMNAMMDGNKTLMLAWGENLLLPNDVKIVFETQPNAIRCCSPAFVSRNCFYLFEEKAFEVDKEEIAAKGLVLGTYGTWTLPNK